MHLALHVLVPAAVAVAIFRKQWQKPFLLMLAGMLIDVDHLLATPIYDAGRCSIGFHPLHHPALGMLYAALTGFPKTRWVGAGLVIHLLLDSIDCQFTNGVWYV
ncbi:MAG: DUF6122 family protein [Pseudomonadota bacterium]